MTLLVVGYGNELRRDDGAGPAVARAVAARGWAGGVARAVRQLVPELAEEVAGAGRVVFVDARAGGGGVRVEEVAGGGMIGLGHTGDPRWLLGLAEALYAARPAAWVVTVPARELGHGEGLTAAARRGVAEAVAVIAKLRAAGS